MGYCLWSRKESDTTERLHLCIHWHTQSQTCDEKHLIRSSETLSSRRTWELPTSRTLLSRTKMPILHKRLGLICMPCRPISQNTGQFDLTKNQNCSAVLFAWICFGISQSYFGAYVIWRQKLWGIWMADLGHKTQPVLVLAPPTMIRLSWGHHSSDKRRTWIKLWQNTHTLMMKAFCWVR